MSVRQEPPPAPPVPPDLLFLGSNSADLGSGGSLPSDVAMEVSPSPVIPVSSSKARPHLGSASPLVGVPSEAGSVPIGNKVDSGSTVPTSSSTPASGTGVEVPFPGQDSGSLPSSEFSWAVKARAASKFPKSNIHVVVSDNGTPRVKVPNAVFERGAQAHTDFIVGIFYGKAPSYGKIWGVLNFLWGKDQKVGVHSLMANAYLFRIPSASLRRKILRHELWHVGDSPFFVTEWKASFSTDPPSLNRAPVWATLSQIPFDLITDEGLGIISKPLGVIVDAKPFSSISSVEIKVIVDLTKKLPSSVEIERENGSVDTLTVIYPWLPPLCSSCGEFGHKVSLCPLLETPPKQNKQKSNPKTPKQRKDKQVQTSVTPAEEDVGILEISAKIVEGSNSRVSQSAPLDVIPEKELPALHVASTDSLLPVSKVRQEPDVFQVPFTPVTKAFKGRVLDIAPAIGTSTSNAFNLLSSDTEPGVHSEIPHEDSGSDREDLNFNGDEAALSLVKVQVTLESGISFVYSAVYASNEVDERRGLWSSLQDTLVSFGLDSKPWMVVGDFNESLGPHESSNVACVSSTSSMREFGEVLCQLGLVDLPSQGPRFTWSNHQPSTPIAKRLDRCLVNNEWLAQFPTAHCSFEPPDFSDHTPCHIRLSSPPPSFGTKAFMFNCALLSLPSFLPTIRLAWEDLDSGNGLLSGLCFKLKKIKMVVRDIAKENFSHIEKRVLQAEDDLRVCQIKSLDDPTPDNFEIERKVRTLWISLRLAEECFFRQRSRNKWLEGGDLNTQFFHSLMIFRNGSNAIKYLLRSDGSRSVSLEEVHQIAERHFSSVLQDIKGDYCVSLKDLLNIIIIFKCSDPKQVIIGAEISSEVIKETLFKMPKSRTPGPDGFPCEFFQATWSFIGEEVLKAVHYFFRAPFMSTALNSTSLVLIPKRPGAESFVKDRLLLENVLLASEVLNGYHSKKSSLRIALKIDISKAFDSVRWDFILIALHAYNIPANIISAIKACITTPAFSLSINGVTAGYFKGRTGLRQGDPLSPVLFVLVMNVLSIMLDNVAKAGIFDYHPGCSHIQLTHLAFADDLLIFSDGSEKSLAGVVSILSQFEKLSGLAIRRKLNGWLHRRLSLAGRLRLISTVISGIVGFWTSAFLLPKRVKQLINSLTTSFLWKGTLDNSNGAKVAWDALCFPKREGGLGLRSISSWNAIFSLKLI
ncbi:uncharacterized protein LOC103862645 [Brassica rapa]|uniref:uncharacterized protein LOC103862645 n=1 Tax=Brassica campestris TaxID=3711 RepID=UPI00142E07E6|nr:uncharacterized protein LOC103862645 [Brassica rapa]